MTSHFYDPNLSFGNSRIAGDASQSIKDYVKTEIVSGAI